MSISRRTFFLSGTATALYGLPSDRIVLGVIGSGGRGTFVMGVFQKDPLVTVGAVCDVYEPNLERALSAAAQVPGNHPKAYRDYKKLLEDREITAVLIAAPEHWHRRMVLDALAAGKDVYVEKPLCRTPEEGVELLAAEARSTNIVQVGMQRRSYDLYLEARRIVAAGTLGTVRMVRSWWLNSDVSPNVPVLNGALDWEQWQGPAPHRPLEPNRFFNWRYFRDYSGGIIADQGAHVFDGIHLLMNAGYPLAVTAAAGKPHKPGVETPESVVATAEYPDDFVAVFTVNYAAMRYKNRNDQLNQYDGDKARLDIGRESLSVYARGAEETPAISSKSEKGFGAATDLHVANFLDSVRTRKPPSAPMRIGFQAALVVQMAGLSLEQGRRIRWNDALKKVEA